MTAGWRDVPSDTWALYRGKQEEPLRVVEIARLWQSDAVEILHWCSVERHSIAQRRESLASKPPDRQMAAYPGILRREEALRGWIIAQAVRDPAVPPWTDDALPTPQARGAQVIAWLRAEGWTEMQVRALAVACEHAAHAAIKRGGLTAEAVRLHKTWAKDRLHPDAVMAEASFRLTGSPTACLSDDPDGPWLQRTEEERAAMMALVAEWRTHGR